MDETCITDLIALAKRIDDIAEEIALTDHRDPHAVQLFRAVLQLRRIISRIPE